jgi:tetratricopeptide (TPR) repeat protein
MLIIHKINEFLYTIFPEVTGGGKDKIINVLEKYYTFGPYKPKITLENDWVKIEIDTPTIISQEADFRKTVSLCERGNYKEAKPILEKLIDKNPTNSEYYRIMGQILSDEGAQDKAVDCLIDSLRWDSKNGWALMMMGNIFAKYKDDLLTAMKYYDQALVAKPNDNIAMNNIGGNLMQQGKIQEAKKYFLDALEINDQYPNTHYALGLIADIENDLYTSFNFSINAIKCNKNKDGLYQNSVRQAFEVAKKIVSTNDGQKIWQNYRYKLEFEGDREIDIVEDNTIPTAAKFEFAENYKRPKHTIRYKPDYPAVEHLIMHELVHLDFVIKARKVELNQLFISNQNHKEGFIKGLEPTIRKLNKMGISEQDISKYCSGLFDGLNLQVYNAPIDLFIEDFIYSDYSDLRPYQFLSLYNMIQNGIKAVTDKEAAEISPNDILSKSKIYNIVNAIQYKELYGIDFIKDHQATPAELKQANEFYEEFIEYKLDKEPAEEYELVMNWAEDLKLHKNFELIAEKEYLTKRTNIDNFLSSIEKDPFNIKTPDPSEKRDMDKFQKSQKEIGTNMSVVMYMVSALEFFQGMPNDEIRKIAFDIALQGRLGYSPDKDGYRIPSIPNKEFSGYNILAYYYVSWALSNPDLLSQLQLPYTEEYELALKMYNPKM